jgi:hypothetical protein
LKRPSPSKPRVKSKKAGQVADRLFFGLRAGAAVQLQQEALRPLDANLKLAF